MISNIFGGILTEVTYGRKARASQAVISQGYKVTSLNLQQAPSQGNGNGVRSVIRLFLIWKLTVVSEIDSSSAICFIAISVANQAQHLLARAESDPLAPDVRRRRLPHREVCASDLQPRRG